jgi:uncharacterized protein (DUF433 family)
MDPDFAGRISIDPAVMGGRPCLRGSGSRWPPVVTALGLMAAGKRDAEILEAYPYLEAEYIRAALAYAAWKTEDGEFPVRQANAS